jgi:glycosyltransferase involved in cell wall biosynthesis
MPALTPTRVALSHVLPVAPASPRPMGRCVLIVSPHFPPINAPDHHRVRLALPHLHEHGWRAEILAVRPADVEGLIDDELLATLPGDVPVHRVSALSPRWTRGMGWGSLARRAFSSLRREGDRLLATGRFDLVFFSTTQFGVLPLGPRWLRRFGVPYVLDFQDEWVSSYYREHPRITPPGGRFKYAWSQGLARRQEKAVVESAAQIITVSPQYHERLRDRHPRIPVDRCHELPFGGAAADFAYLERSPARQDFFSPGPQCRHGVYVGRGGADLHHATTAFFQALRQAIQAGGTGADPWHFHFLGTSYAPGGRAPKTFAPIARDHGLEERVTEQSARIPYFTALRCLRDADALIAFGSNEPGYTASKIFPLLLSRRPLLAIFHEESSVVPMLRETGAATVITFSPTQPVAETAARIFSAWWLAGAFLRTPVLNEKTFAPFDADAMTRRLTKIFSAALTPRTHLP